MTAKSVAAQAVTSNADEDIPVFFVFSRSDAWVDPDMTCQLIANPIPFDVNEDGVSFEEIQCPDFMTNWRRFEMSIDLAKQSSFFSDLLVSDDVYSGLPDLFRLNRWVHITPRTRETLIDLGCKSANYIPVQISPQSNPTSGSIFYVMITGTFFHHTRLDEHGDEPNIDFDYLVFRTPLTEIQEDERITNYLSKERIWSLFPSFEKPFFSAELFGALKLAGLSGIEEKRSKLSLVYEGQEAIGHVFG